MSCQRELKRVQLAAPAVPEVSPSVKNGAAFRAGYVYGFQDALRESLEIVEEHEDEESE